MPAPASLLAIAQLIAGSAGIGKAIARALAAEAVDSLGVQASPVTEI
jgi:hypothetical protein